MTKHTKQENIAMNTRFKKMASGVALFLGLSTVAYAFPWDIDMVDALFTRGYEQPMKDLPAGTISNQYRPNGLEHMDPEMVAKDWATTGGQSVIPQAASTTAVQDPFVGKEKDTATLLQGEKAFQTYCQTCHGIKGTGKTLDGETAWPMQAPNRWGPVNNLHMASGGKVNAGIVEYKSTSELYLIVRNGRGRMPAYGHAMSDAEIWSAIHYAKSLPGQTLAETVSK